MERNVTRLACAFAWSIVLTLSGGCNLKDDARSDTNDLVAGAGAKNIALMASAYNMDDDDRYWSKASIDQLRWALNGIRGPRSIAVREKHDLTSQQLVAMTTKAAKDVGNEGTLIWYVASHGWTDGFVAADEVRLKPKDIVAALRAGRQRPIRRLILMFDYCGAGGMVDGMSLAPDALTGGALNDLGKVQAPDEWTKTFVDELAAQGPKKDGFSLDDATDFPLYEQAIYISPVTKIQTTSGSTFTEAMAAVVQANWVNESLTIRTFLEESAAKILETSTHEYPTANDADVIEAPQKMVFRALPDDSFLDETLFSVE